MCPAAPEILLASQLLILQLPPSTGSTACTSPMPAFTVLGFLQILTHAPALAQVTSWVQPMPLPLGASYVPDTAVGLPEASQAWVKWSHYPPHLQMET